MEELNLEDWQDPSVIRAALARKRIAVVGMSSKSSELVTSLAFIFS